MSYEYEMRILQIVINIIIIENIIDFHKGFGTVFWWR